MQQLNQFSQTSDRGQIALRGEGNNLISVIVDATEVGTIKAGDMVVLSGSKGGLPTVKKATGAEEVALGFAVYNIVQNEHKAGELLEVALSTVCMKMEASDAIQTGKKVAYTALTGLVSATEDEGSAVGIALTEAKSANDLLVVYIKTI